MPRNYTIQEIQSIVNSIKGNIETFITGVTGHVANEVVLVLGSTGSGKSTVMNMLAQKQMKASHFKGAYRLDVIEELDSIVKNYAGEITAPGFLPMKIGHNSDSETKFPNYITLNGKQLWDCPGFGDTRDLNVDISNMYYVHHILQEVAHAEGSVKFIVVQDNAGATTAGGKLFRDSVKTICKIFPSQSIQSLVDATTFVFTKVPNTEVKNSEYLEDVLDRVTPDIIQKDEQRLVEFLNTMRINTEAIKHIEIPETNTSIPLDNINYIIEPIAIPLQTSFFADGIRNAVPLFVISLQSHATVIEIATILESSILHNVDMMLHKIINERIKSCYGTARYKQKLADEQLTPIASVINNIVKKSDTLVSKISSLSHQLLKLIKINTNHSTQGTINVDEQYIQKKMQDTSILAQNLDFFSFIDPSISSKCSSGIDIIGLSLVGEIDTFSTKAHLALNTETLTQNGPSCILL